MSLSPITRRRVGHVDYYVARASGATLLRSTRRLPYQFALWCAQTPRGESTGWAVSFHSTQALAARALSAWSLAVTRCRAAKRRLQDPSWRPSPHTHRVIVEDLPRLEAIYEHLSLVPIDTLPPA